MKMNSNFIIVCTTLTLSFGLLAQETKPTAPTPRPGGGMVRPERVRPQSGKVIGIDKAAPAITVGPMEGAPAAIALTSNIVVNIATNTLFFKNGKKVTLNDIAVGDPVRFQIRKGPEGKTIAPIILVGPAPTRSSVPAVPAPKR